MKVQWSFYICPSCFATSETPGECHGRAIVYLADSSVSVVSY